MIDLIAIVTHVWLGTHTLQIQPTPLVATTAAGSAAAATTASTAAAGDIVDNVQKFYANIKQVTSVFKQTVMNSTFGTSKDSSGTVWLMKPGKMRWDYVEKKKTGVEVKKSFISNGTTLYDIEHDNKQVIKKNLQQDLMPVAVTFLYGKGDLKAEFNAALDPNSSYGAKDDLVLKLTPKKPSAQYKNLYLVVNKTDFHVKESVIIDASNNVNHFRFFAPDFKKSIKDSWFEFDERSVKNYRVIDADQQAPPPPDLRRPRRQRSDPNIDANGLRFAYLEQGRGPLVVMLHGFPDTAYTWAHVMPELARAGSRVVAPFMRGYHPTQLPKPGVIDPDTTGRDVLALIAALGEATAIVVGHDWGASAAYAAASLEPGAPAPGRHARDPASALAQADAAQRVAHPPLHPAARQAHRRQDPRRQLRVHRRARPALVARVEGRARERDRARQGGVRGAGLPRGRVLVLCATDAAAPGVAPAAGSRCRRSRSPASTTTSRRARSRRRAIATTPRTRSSRSPAATSCTASIPPSSMPSSCARCAITMRASPERRVGEVY